MAQIFFAIALFLFTFTTAFAVKKDAAPSATKSGSTASSSDGPFSLIEWNPADLLANRVRLASEYIIIDGFAFGVAAEFQRETNEKWRHSTAATGITATQYFESQTMRGTFVKGEADVFHTQYTIANKSEDKSIFGMGLGLDLGYRFAIAKNFTGAASYGVRRNLPDFFNAKGAPAPKDVTDNMKVWDVRLNLSVGVAL